MNIKLHRAKKFVCVNCGRDHSGRFATLCGKCGELVEVQYDLGSVRLHASENPYLRFRDLLPIEDPALLPEVAGYTPLVHAARLGREIGMRRLYLKNETVLPTGTTKDRNAGVVLALLWECGIRHFCTSSTGNSGSAYIRELSRYPEMTMYLFSGEDFVDRVRAEGTGKLVWYGLRGGTFEEAGKMTREFAAQHGLVSEHGFFNFGKREGAKLAFFEAVEQLGGPFDWYVQAISSGLGAYGTFKGARELKDLGIIPRLPRLLCVQQASCAPQVSAYAGHSDVIRPQDAVARPTGIAHAILSGNPGKAYTYMKRAVEQSGGDYQAVNEGEIREARMMVEELEGIEVCFSAAAALAGVIKAHRLGRMGADDSVMVNLTGRDVVGTDFSGLRWLEKVNGGWQADERGAETVQLGREAMPARATAAQG